ncbi:hypothetical protein COLO4_19675 [Corchorus olitorius]|uniref:4-hydroxyphenylpyruvate dioxygenase n=1 Tax=Corchorus olitorius TaxID=93759 RepID=A0A1R3J456_9ROSI|nr:hypothetical protein COLO4_19675 [Corchorus olitorius]
MQFVAKSDLSTGNMTHASHLLRSGELDFLFTALTLLPLLNPKTNLRRSILRKFWTNQSPYIPIWIWIEFLIYSSTGKKKVIIRPIHVPSQNLFSNSTAFIPTFDHSACCAFSASHGLGVRAIAIEVEVYRSRLHHLGLMSKDIFKTLRETRKRSFVGGFEFMSSPPPTYYKNLKNRARVGVIWIEIKDFKEKFDIL